MVLAVQVREKDGLTWIDGGGAGAQQLELGPGVEVEPTKLANALDAKDEGGNVTDDSVGLGLNQYLHAGATY